MTENGKVVLLREIGNAVDSSISSVEASRDLKEKAGHPMWDTLHYIGKVADDEGDRELYLSLLDIYAKGHPCAKECRAHLIANLDLIDPETYISLFQHSVDLHNLVNRQLRKPEFSLDKANERYDLDCDSCVFTPSGKSQSSIGASSADE